jgi:hypothetical protein
MFVPPYQTVLKALGLSADDVKGGGDIVISKKLFRFMLTAIVRESPIDEAAYLVAYPDVADAVAKGEMASGREHFAGIGYFEGRLAGSVRLDEAWYLKTYPDVGDAPPAGRTHYFASGIREGRVPYPGADKEIQAWNVALAPNSPNGSGAPGPNAPDPGRPKSTSPKSDALKSSTVSSAAAASSTADPRSGRFSVDASQSAQQNKGSRFRKLLGGT